jgi:ABC-type bacteriocin/lantibiotic exporter with double-glycine peptidase domain
MRNTLLVDAAIALVLAIVVIVISPGLAVVGLLALAVLLICVVSFLIDRRRRRRRSNPVAELRRSRGVEARAARRSSPQRGARRR